MTIEEIRKKLSDKVVAIAGCGGLGSNCAVALARVGIGKLILADFDRVEQGNLNRQYFFRDQVGEYKSEALRDNILRIDENLNVEVHVVNLEPESVKAFFADCDIIVEAFDTDAAKQMIIETVLSDMPEKYIISGQGLGGFGNNEGLKTERHDKLFIIGDRQTEVSDEQPPLGPRVGVVANMQANLVLEILLNEE
jgi:sulfur carrier protein ThiS adenylyltransferase